MNDGEVMGKRGNMFKKLPLIFIGILMLCNVGGAAFAWQCAIVNKPDMDAAGYSAFRADLVSIEMNGNFYTTDNKEDFFSFLGEGYYLLDTVNYEEGELSKQVLIDAETILVKVTLRNEDTLNSDIRLPERYFFYLHQVTDGGGFYGFEELYGVPDDLFSNQSWLLNSVGHLALNYCEHLVADRAVKMHLYMPVHLSHLKKMRSLEFGVPKGESALDYMVQQIEGIAPGRCPPLNSYWVLPDEGKPLHFAPKEGQRALRNFYCDWDNRRRQARKIEQLSSHEKH